MVVARDPWLSPVIGVAVLVAATYVATLADNYVGPLFVWGGLKCGGTIGGVEGCFSYSPAGLILIAAVAAAVAGVGASALARRRE